MRLYTIVQLAEVVLFLGVLTYGFLARRPSVVALAGGMLAGKATLNILAPEGGSVLRRSVVGYSAGAVYVAIALAAIHVR